MAARKKASPRKKPTTRKKGAAAVPKAIDPVSSTLDDVQVRLQEASGSILHNAPLRQWVVGMCELKASVGSQLSWDDIAARLHLAAEAAIEPGARIAVDGVDRRPTKEELDVLKSYASCPMVPTSIRNYLKKAHTKLWIRVKATANARGTGTRSDERR